MDFRLYVRQLRRHVGNDDNKCARAFGLWFKGKCVSAHAFRNDLDFDHDGHGTFEHAKFDRGVCVFFVVANIELFDGLSRTIPR